jgi:HEAT repeat protein
MAAAALGRFGPAAGPALEELRKRLADENEDVRIAAARSIGSFGEAGGAAVGDLMARINTDTGPVALAAADALAAIGGPAVPVLIKALADPSLRGLAFAVLERLGPAAAPAAHALSELLVNLDEQTSTQAAITLGAIGPDAKEAVPALLALVKSDQPERLRAAAVYALGQLKAKEALPDIERALGSAEPLLSMAAAHAVVSLEPENEKLVAAAVPKLIAGLQSERPKVRAGIAKALGRLGARAAAAVPALRPLLEDPEPAVRAEAAGALGQIGAKDLDTVASLTKLLDDPAPLVRYSATFALGRAGAAAAKTTPVLEEKLDSPDPFEAAVAAWALLRIAPSATRAAQAAPRLLAVLSHPSPAVRIETARTLGEIANGDAATIKALQAALAAEDVPEVRTALEQAIKAAGSPQR